MSERLLIAFVATLLMQACGTEPKEKKGPDEADAAADVGVETDATGFGDVADTGEVDSDVVVVPEAACLEVSSGPSVDLEQVPVDEVHTHEVTIANCSATAALEVSSVSVCTDVDGSCESASTVLAVDAGALPAIEPGGAATVVITVAAETEGDITGALTLEANTPEGMHAVPVMGLAVLPCPVAVADAKSQDSTRYQTDITTTPLKTIQFRGSNSTAQIGQIETYEWTVVERPVGSSAQFLPGSDVADPTLFLDLAGDYLVELKVTDDEGRESCGAPAQITIRAIPDEDISIELTWSTPADPDETDANGNDVDLHFLHPNGTWNQQPYDIFWNNPTSPWGAPGPADDPSLDVDDSDGAGPELITHSDLESGLPYRVGVYYYADAGYGPAYATVRIYMNGVLQFEQEAQYLATIGTFWDVATITWSGAPVIFAVNQVHQGFPNRP